MQFSDILSKSWSTFTSNFRSYFTLSLFLYILPLALLNAVNVLYGSTLPLDAEGEIILEGAAMGIAVGLGTLTVIVSLITTILLTTSLVRSFVEKKTDWRAALAAGRPYFWKTLGFYITIGFFLLLLFLLLFIPGIIFSVYWAFAFILLIAENRPIIESLKQSKSLVTGRWWKVFGYLILYELLIIAAFIGIGFVLVILSLILAPFPLLIELLSTTLDVLLTGIMIIFGFIFIYTLYLELKGSEKAASRPKRAKA